MVQCVYIRTIANKSTTGVYVTDFLFNNKMNNNNNALYFYTHIQSTTLFKGVYND